MMSQSMFDSLSETLVTHTLDNNNLSESPTPLTYVVIFEDATASCSCCCKQSSMMQWHPVPRPTRAVEDCGPNCFRTHSVILAHGAVSKYYLKCSWTMLLNIRTSTYGMLSNVLPAPLAAAENFLCSTVTHVVPNLYLITLRSCFTSRDDRQRVGIEQLPPILMYSKFTSYLLMHR